VQTFTIWSSYHQIGLWDLEDSVNAYPEFPAIDDIPDVIFGAKGVSVLTRNDYEVLVHIGAIGEVQATLQSKVLKGKGVITVGNRGVEVGNETSADIHQVPCASGVIGVEVWGDPDPFPSSITFILSDTYR
jgi:hypothetical protein